MKKTIKKIFVSSRGAVDIVTLVVELAILLALIPIIYTFAVAGRDTFSCPNGTYPHLSQTLQICSNQTVLATAKNISAVRVGLSASEFTLLTLTALFMILGLVFMVVKQSGLMKK